MKTEIKEIKQKNTKNRIELGLDNVSNRLRPGSLFNVKDGNQAYISAATDRLNISGRVFQSNIYLKDSNDKDRFHSERKTCVNVESEGPDSRSLAKSIKQKMVTDNFQISPKRHSVSPYSKITNNEALRNAKPSEFLKEMRNSSYKFSYESPVKASQIETRHADPAAF